MVAWSDELRFLLDLMDGRVHVHHLPGEEMAGDALWEDGRLAEAVFHSGIALL